MESEILIEVNHLSRAFLRNKGFNKNIHDQTIAVDDISFNLLRGEVLGFLGPNGAGKSTTMQMLTGNLAPGHGSIKIGGLDLMDNPIEAKAMIGYLPDTPPLYKELTVDEYLAYCARLNRIPKHKLQQAINISKERCGLTEHGKRVINNLSKGYQQRAGIAQAIIHSPDIVILDEPTVGLDPIQMIAIRKLIKELGETHSVMLSSHILPEIQTICDNVQIINQGKLVFNASIEQLNHQMQTHSIRMKCRHKMDIKQIERLDAINSVEVEKKAMGDDEGESIIIYCSHNCASNDFGLKENEQNAVIGLSQQLISMAEQQQWGLYEIYPEKQTLEDIFMSLTRVESAAEVITGTET